MSARPGGTQAHYRAVAATLKLKPKKVKEVVEAMFAVAAIELKLVGSFKIARALSMKLTKKPAREYKKLVRFRGACFVCYARPEHNVVKIRSLKWMTKMMERYPG